MLSVLVILTVLMMVTDTLLLERWIFLHLLLVLLTHLLTPVALEEQVVLARAEQALLRQDLLHLDTLLVKHLPEDLLHLVTALDLHLHPWRVVLLKVLSLVMMVLITSLLQALFSAPLPHFLMATLLATRLHLFTLSLLLTMTVLLILTRVTLFLPR